MIGDQRVVARGRQRMVLNHPRDTAMVIKVPHAVPHWGSRTRSLNRILLTANRHIQRERDVYADIAKIQIVDARPPIPDFHGTVPTDLGPADVYEAIRTPCGKRLGPTLRTILRKTAPDTVLVDRLNDMLRALLDWNIPVTDMTASNIVLGHRDGRKQFVLVDGFGDYRLVPVARWSRRARAERLAKGSARIAAKYGLTWDAAAGQFGA